MSAQAFPVPPARGTALDTSSFSTPIPSPSVWERISTWASENKAVVYTIAGVAVVVTGAGVVYYLSDLRKELQSDAASEEKRASKKERRKAKKEKEKEKIEPEKDAATASSGGSPEIKPKAATVEAAPSDELPEINEVTVETFSEQELKTYSVKLKLAGNKAYGDKAYNKAIEYYGKAILCKPDPVYYSNRAACYSALGDWDKVIEDTTAAIALDNEYIKALNRRGNAYEQVKQDHEALLDYTAACIVNGFQNEASAANVERMLKKIAETKAKIILETRGKKLPSPTFITNYLGSFRNRPLPAELEETVELDEQSGKAQLRVGLLALRHRTAAGYDEATAAFDKALELGELGGCDALAYNMRGTFRYLRSRNQEALDDLSKSIELDSTFTQSYIKRASMHLELGSRDSAAKDFESAMQKNPDDPDIYYHRGQLHFILGEFTEAAKDYQKSIEIDKDFLYSHIQLGVTQYKMGSIVSSMATFRRCIKNFDRSPDVYNYYGELLLDQQKYQESVDKFDVAIELEKQMKPMAINVLPIINKALAVYQWKNDYQEAEKLVQKALIIDPDCDIATATMAQLLLQQGKVAESLNFFQRSAESSRTEGEIVNALSYAEATKTQLEVTEKYPHLASRLDKMVPGGMRG